MQLNHHLARMDVTYTDCQDCHGYMRVRLAERGALSSALAVRSLETGETAQQILDRYMGGVHARHLAGHSIVIGGAA